MTNRKIEYWVIPPTFDRFDPTDPPNQALSIGSDKKATCGIDICCSSRLGNLV